MPTNYSGNPSNITTPLSRSIISCASGAGGLVLVGTSGAHLFSTYDYVSISGVVGTTEANCVDQITVINSTQFLLSGTPFVTPYSSGGTAQDISLTPYFEMPDNGEVGTADSIEADIQALADRTQWLVSHGLIGTGSSLQSNATYGTIIGGASGSTTWTNTAMAVTFTKRCKVGDVLLISGQAHAWILGTGGSVMEARIAVTDGGVVIPLPETVFRTSVNGASVPTEVPTWPFSTRYVVTAAGTITVTAQVRLSTNAGDQANLACNAALSVAVYRPQFLR